MVGLGTGARSYTNALHYATPFAVKSPRVRAIVEGFIAARDEDFGVARHGIWLDAEDQRRRFAILCLLADGLDLGDYRARFATEALTDLPQLEEIIQAGWATAVDDRLVLNDQGIERSDAVGPFLRSPRVKALMEAWEPT